MSISLTPQSTPEMIKKSMTLGYNRPDEGFTVDKACGQITISVVFRPVPSVAKSGLLNFLFSLLGSLKVKNLDHMKNQIVYEQDFDWRG